MKIIALLPFKNEGWILSEYIASVKKITDTILVFDDSSTDNSRQLLLEAGAKIITENYKKESGWAEYEIRERLLEEGRKNGGTHFICLDADEVFSNNFYANAYKVISSLKSGQNLWMDWVTLYGGLNSERTDGIYKNLSKSFIFCDDGTSRFPYVFLGVSRIPTDPANRLVLGRERGAVIHFHYVNLQRAAVKRAWYMCSELIKADRSAFRINVTYYMPKIKTAALKDSDFELTNSNIATYDSASDWRLAGIKVWFSRFGVKYFEALDIWNVQELLKIFKAEVGRYPEPAKVPPWLISVNNLKNAIKNAL